LANKMTFNPDHKAVLDELLLDNPLVRPAKMFGLPAYYVGKKLAICVYEQGVGVKLPEQTANELIETDPNVVAFRPMGRHVMRAWVEIDLDRSDDYRDYTAVFDESISHVLSLQADKS
jgi:hypothetical protein